MVVYTTWNTLRRVLEELPGNWEGFDYLKEDVEVCLVPLCPGWLEVLVKNHYGTFDFCYYDAQGDPTALRDWVLNEDMQGEGIAVPESVVEKLKLF
jgi:hypothetical protein